MAKFKATRSVRDKSVFEWLRFYFPRDQGLWQAAAGCIVEVPNYMHRTKFRIAARLTFRTNQKRRSIVEENNVSLIPGSALNFQHFLLEDIRESSRKTVDLR